MRISTNTFYDLGTASIQQQTSNLVRTQQQLSSGRRVLTPSDDPVAAAKMLEINQSDSINTQYMSNADTAMGSLQLEESALSHVTTLIQDVQSIAVSAGNAALSNADRASMATELSSRYQDLLGLANATDSDGHYLFSGYKGATQPFAETAPGQVAYSGDQGQRLLQISASRQIPVSDSGFDVFQRIKNGNGTFVTSAVSTNNGAGTSSPGVVLDSAKWAASSQDYTIRFAANTNVTVATDPASTAAVSAGIVDQTAWNAGGKSLQVSFAGAGAPYTYTITDAATPTAHTTTGTYTPAPGATLKVNFGGADIVLSGTPVAGDTFTIKPSATPGWTYDIIDNKTSKSLLSSPASASSWSSSWRTYTSGQAISLVSQGSEPAFDTGVSTIITNDPAAGDKFTIKASTNQDLFATINNLITTLKSNLGTGNVANQASFTNGLNAAMSNLDNALNNVLTVRAAVGAHMKEVDAVKTMGGDLALQYQQSLSQLQDLDYAKAATDLTKQQAALDAAQKSFLKIQSLSLFSLL